MSEGTIKKLVTERGFGFIEGERGELFFHSSSVQGTSFEALVEGQRVDYTEGRGPKGPRASRCCAAHARSRRAAQGAGFSSAPWPRPA